MLEEAELNSSILPKLCSLPEISFSWTIERGQFDGGKRRDESFQARAGRAAPGETSFKSVELVLVSDWRLRRLACKILEIF